MPRETLLEIFAAAVAAPSAGNRQPWRFLAVTDRARIEAMAAAAREASERVALAVDARAADAFRAYAGRFTIFTRAPVVVVPLWRPTRLLTEMLAAPLPGEDGEAAAALEAEGGIVSASLALENLLLAAHGLGLGAVVTTGALVARGRLREILAIRGTWQVLALVALGYPDEAPPAPPRRPV